MIRTNNWVYIHIPKTSGTNFIINSKHFSNSVKDCYSKYHYHFKHQPLWWWEQYDLINKDDYVFTIVRNPYSRFVSLYNHIKLKVTKIQILDFDNFIKTNQLSLVNKIIEEEVSSLKDLLVWKVDWTQTKFLRSTTNKQVNIYKLESDLKKLEKFVGYTFTGTCHNKHEHRPWKTYYNKYTLDIIYNKYKEDFLTFDYKK